jgi:hypothetical protein
MRRTIVQLHMFLSALFLPLIFLVAITGGCYLMGWKGSETRKEIGTYDTQLLDEGNKSNHLASVKNILESVKQGADFEYLKYAGNSVFTRPTSRTYYSFQEGKVFEVKPDLLRSVIELHKGHGPQAFKFLSKLLALALFFVAASGAYLAMTSRLLRKPFFVSVGLSSVVILFTLI